MKNELLLIENENSKKKMTDNIQVLLIRKVFYLENRAVALF